MTAASGLWLIPPHRDATLQVEPDPGWTVLDLGAALMDRLLAPAALAATAAAWRVALGAGGSPRALLELEAAREVLQRSAAELSARLRAQGTALAVLTAGGPIRLRLDDLELATGSTQRSADLLQLARSPDLPFGPELDLALEAVAVAPRVRVLVDCDQRLPFTFALCHRLASREGRPPLTLCGPFAHRHQEALRANLPGVEIDSLLPTATLEGAPWRWDGQGAVEEGPWRGYLTLEALAAGGPAPLLGVVPFAALEEERVLSLQGSWYPRRLLTEAGARFPLVGEWHFGAPVPADLVEQTAARLLATFAWPADGGGVVAAGQPVPRMGLDWLGGLRRFHWSVERPPQMEFAGQPLTLAPVDPALDLARSRGFQAPGMMEEPPLLALVEKVLVALSRGPRPPSPGRVAAGLCRIPTRTAAPGAGWLRLAPDAALVELPVAMDGRPQRTAVATSLRTGAMLAVDPRLLPFLRRLHQPGPAGDFLPGVAAGMREKLMSTLLDRRILEALPEGGVA